MRTIIFALFSLFFISSVHASGPFTLSDIERIHIFVKNDSELFDDKDVEQLKEKLSKLVQTLRLKAEGRDAPTLMLKIESISDQKKHYLHVKLALGEDIITKRKGDTRTFALTYDASDFIESEEPKKDLFESVEFLTDEFISHFKDDNE
jgi:hypothetical protein